MHEKYTYASSAAPAAVMRLCTGLGIGLVSVSAVLVMWSIGVGREEPVRSFVSWREAHPVPELLLMAIKNPEARVN